MANATSTQLQELYVAYFGRAADPTGLDYWTEKGITTTKFAADMYAQAEFKDAYGSLSTESQVNQIYKNLFDREADVTGLTYWTQQINLGVLKVAEIATHLVWAAQNNDGSSDDKTALANRTAAAIAYTAEVKGSVAAILAYQPESTGETFTKGVNISEAISYLSGIDKDTAHTAAGITSSVAKITTNGVPSVAVSGKSITLTSGGDVVNTTSATAALTSSEGNDVIYGLADGLLTSADVIDGGGGTDKVDAKVKAAGQTLKPRLTSIEELATEIQAVDSKDVTVDLGLATAVSKLTITGSGDSAVDKTAVTVKGVQLSDAISIDSGMTTSANVWLKTTVTYDAVTGDSDSAAITLGGNHTDVVIAGIETVSATVNDFEVATLTVEDAETVTITSGETSTTKSTIIKDIAQSAADLATLNLAGSGEDITVGGGTAINFAKDGVVNITNTGTTTLTLADPNNALYSLTVTGAGGKDAIDISAVKTTKSVSVTTGAGDDTVTIDAADVTIDTGAGDDTIVGVLTKVTKTDSIEMGDGTKDIFSSAAEVTIDKSDVTAFGYVKNAEILQLTKTNDHFIIDLDGFTGADHVILSGAHAEEWQGTSTKAGVDRVVYTSASDDTLEISAAIIGEGGGKKATASTGDGKVGGDGIDVDPIVDNGNNIATLRFVGDADLTGGVGEIAANGKKGGAGGDAIQADKIDQLNLVIVGTKKATAASGDTVKFTGGAGGSSKDGKGTDGDAGDSIEVSANGKIVLTSELDPFTSTAGTHNDVDLGTVNGTNVTIDGSAFLGAITAVAATGNVTITGGAGKDVLSGGTGIDTIDGGANDDTIDAGGGVDVLTGGAGADTFKVSSGDVGITTAETISDFATGALGVADLIKYSDAVTLIGDATGTDVSAAISGKAGGDTLTATVSKGFITLAGNAIAKIDTLAEVVDVFEIAQKKSTKEVGAMEWEGDTYFFGIAAAGDETCDDVIKLAGVTGITAVSTTPAANTIYVATL